MSQYFFTKDGLYVNTNMIRYVEKLKGCAKILKRNGGCLDEETYKTCREELDSLQEEEKVYSVQDFLTDSEMKRSP